MRSLRLATAATALTLVAFAHAASAGAPAATSHDLSGTWRIDPARSDKPAPPPSRRADLAGGPSHMPDMGAGVSGPAGDNGDMGRPPEGGPEGEMRHGQGGEGGPPAGEPGEHREGGDRGLRRPGLPPYLTITSTPEVIAIADSAGAVVQQITLKDLPADAPAVQKSAPHVPGTWKNDKLIVTRTNSRGVKVTETFSLEDKGATLVVRTKMEPPDGAGFEIKRVYRRAG